LEESDVERTAAARAAAPRQRGFPRRATFGRLATVAGGRRASALCSTRVKTQRERRFSAKNSIIWLSSHAGSRNLLPRRLDNLGNLGRLR
jgi:hypothetical protein